MVRRTLDEWKSIIQECRASGLSDLAWCTEHNVSLSSFYRKLQTLRQIGCSQDIDKASVPSVPVKQEVVPINYEELPEVKPVRNSMPAGNMPSNPAVRVCFGNVSVEISNTADADLVRNTLSVLRSLC